MQDLSAVETVFDEDFDLLVTPLAYDLHIALALADGVEHEHVYGVPADPGGAPRYEVDVATVFTSRRHGAATFLRLARGSNGAVGSMSFTYEPETAHGLPAPAAADTALTIPSGDGGAAETPLGVRKGIFLINQAEQMRAACDAYHAGDGSGAGTILDELLTYMRAEQAAMATDDLDAEIALVERLAENVSRAGG